MLLMSGLALFRSSQSVLRLLVRGSLLACSSSHSTIAHLIIQKVLIANGFVPGTNQIEAEQEPLKCFNLSVYGIGEMEFRDCKINAH